MLAIFIIITLIYLGIISSLILGFDKVDTLYLTDIPNKTDFSIIVPFRNESHRLVSLLSSLRLLDYPIHKFELIFADDNSTDESVNLIQDSLKDTDLKFQILRSASDGISPKKAAIDQAIRLAKYSWIVTTDADCKVPIYWLQSLDNLIQKNNPDMVLGPVLYSNENTWLDRFQVLENLSLQAVTIGSCGVGKPFLCNGANLGYRKSLYLDCEGFKGNEKISSGDDVFMLEKALQFNFKVDCLKSTQAIVETSTEQKISGLVAQHIRWASKTKRVRSTFGKILAISVFLMNASLIVASIYCALGTITLKNLAAIFVIKISLDFLLIFKTARFFGKDTVLLSYVWSCFIYPIFSVFIAIRSVFGGFKWKDRSYRY